MFVKREKSNKAIIYCCFGTDGGAIKINLLGKLLRRSMSRTLQQHFTCSSCNRSLRFLPPACLKQQFHPYYFLVFCTYTEHRNSITKLKLMNSRKGDGLN